MLNLEVYLPWNNGQFMQVVELITGGYWNVIKHHLFHKLFVRELLPRRQHDDNTNHHIISHNWDNYVEHSLYYLPPYAPIYYY